MPKSGVHRLTDDECKINPFYERLNREAREYKAIYERDQTNLLAYYKYFEREACLTVVYCPWIGTKG